MKVFLNYLMEQKSNYMPNKIFSVSFVEILYQPFTEKNRNKKT